MKLNFVVIISAAALLSMGNGLEHFWLHDTKPPKKCTPVICGKKGDFCSKCTICMNGTSCLDGECRKNIDGDICSNGCSDEGLYCNHTRCMPRVEEGQKCVYRRDECGTDLYCDATITERTGVCRRYPDEGETCRRHKCRDGLDCEYDEIDEFGICRKSPRNIGDECSRGHGCGGVESGLFCNVTGDSDYLKSNEYKFIGTCVPLPGLNGDCSYSGICKSGFECVEYNCVPNPAPKNGYCDNSRVFCGPGLFCFSNVCGDSTKIGNNCTTDSECENYPKSFCVQNKCVPALSVGRGGECYHDDLDEYGIYGTLQCKEGLGCVPENASSSGFMCKPITTDITSVLKCDGEKFVCPEDSFCGCNDENGVIQCIPYMKSSEALLGEYERFVNGREKKVDNEIVAAIRSVVSRSFTYDGYYRCGSWEKKYTVPSEDSRVVVSSLLMVVLMMMVSLLF